MLFRKVYALASVMNDSVIDPKTLTWTFLDISCRTKVLVIKYLGLS